MKWGFCTQMAVCYWYGILLFGQYYYLANCSSAILLLENPSVHERDLNLGGYMDLTVNEMSSSATAALQSALDIISYFAVDSWTCYRTSPFLSHFLYKAATIYLGSSHVAPGGPAEHKLQTLKQALQLVNGRWLAAGEELHWMLWHVQYTNTTSRSLCFSPGKARNDIADAEYDGLAGEYMHADRRYST